ncbi:MAG: hypothetical protein PWP24_2026, partial [Clostridiales bacterium]|nr:hypothetical protein [Clostridiales bacterium]
QKSEPKEVVITVDSLFRNKILVVEKKLISYAETLYQAINPILLSNVLNENQPYFFLQSVLCMAWVCVFAAISLLLRRYEYGLTMLSCVVTIGILFVLLGASTLGLPQLMDVNRTRIYIVYLMPLIWAFTIDAPIYTLLGFLKRKWFMYMVSLFVCLAVGVFLSKYTALRQPRFFESLETNGAITSLTNIIREDKNFSWTIVSANDERNMANGHGYHYELIQFLRDIESAGQNTVAIPTPYVYFFIEKAPLDTDRKVSKEGAQNELPVGGDIAIYQEENRWIVMSRFYYWAKTYQEMYHNEMKVYYEDDTFICYQIKQNINHLNNFAIDYGYNKATAAGS